MTRDATKQNTSAPASGRVLPGRLPSGHKLGGYETWLGTNKVQKDASRIIVSNLIEMLEQLRERQQG